MCVVFVMIVIKDRSSSVLAGDLLVVKLLFFMLYYIVWSTHLHTVFFAQVPQKHPELLVVSALFFHNDLIGQMGGGKVKGVHVL